MIAGEGKSPAIDHILRVGDEFDFRKIDVLDIVDRVNDAVGNWPSFSQNAGGSKSVADRIKNEFVRFDFPVRKTSSEAVCESSPPELEPEDFPDPTMSIRKCRRILDPASKCS